jgi:hypothetical protein
MRFFMFSPVELCELTQVRASRNRHPQWPWAARLVSPSCQSSFLWVNQLLVGLPELLCSELDLDFLDRAVEGKWGLVGLRD